MFECKVTWYPYVPHIGSCQFQEIFHRNHSNFSYSLLTVCCSYLTQFLPGLLKVLMVLTTWVTVISSNIWRFWDRRFSTGIGRELTKELGLIVSALWEFLALKIFKNLKYFVHDCRWDSGVHLRPLLQPDSVQINLHINIEAISAVCSYQL